MIETTLILGLFTWIIIYEKPKQNRIDNDLKYRYIKMKGDASAEQTATLEDIFELNRNTEAIEQMREDVEIYEEAVRKQAALAEQARLKEQAAKEQESKAKSIKDKQEQPKDNPNKKSKPWAYGKFMHEWNEDNNAIIATNNSRQNYLQSIEERIDWDIKRLQSTINQWENKRQRYTADDIISTFQKQANEQSLFNFMQSVIVQQQQMGKQRTSETYRCTLKSFMQFREDKDVLLETSVRDKKVV